MREKMRSFVSDASHELRSPLTAIHGFAEVLSMGAAKDEEQLQSSLTMITSETERLTKLVNDLLLLTQLDHKIETPMQPQDLGQIIQELEPQLRLLGGERQLRLSLAENLIVPLNRDQIKQVIINLVQNAFQHTSDRDGLITISLESVLVSDEHCALIKVTDNGSGISSENLDSIYDRFYRETSHRSRKQGGYGLGLSIVKSIVEAHGGKITVTSTVGSGTTFSIYLRESPVE
jgi:two-component system OmpR family sensor kinase